VYLVIFVNKRSRKMNKSDSITVHDEQAAEYDQQVREYRWFGPEGLGSMPFAKTGLEIFGIDGSVEMLKICKSKEFATDLKQFNLQNTPRPFGNPKRLGRTDVHAQR
jgi:hypothetical protein